MRAFGLIVMLVGAALSLASAQDISDKDGATKVLALEHIWNQAEQSRDIKAMDALFENGMIYVDFDGKLISKAEFMKEAQSGKVDQEVTENMVAHQFDDTVVVVGIYRQKGVEKGKPYQRRGRFMDTWIYTLGKWVCVVSQATPLPH